MIKQRKYTKLASYFALYAVVIVAALIFTGHKTYAITNNNANIPASVQATAFEGCIATGNSVAQEQWLSAVGQPLVQSATVAAGTTSINLQWNTAVYYCDNGYTVGTSNPDVTIATNAVVDSVSPNYFNDLVGKQMTDTYNHSDLWSQNALTFTFQVPPNSQVITVTEANQFINYFNTTNTKYEYQCVGSVPAANGYSRGSLTNFNGAPACPQFESDLSFTIVIQQPPETIQGRIYNFQTGAAAVNVPVYTCNYGTVYTNANGFYSFSVPKGGAFCLRVNGDVVTNQPGLPANVSSPVYIRPYAVGGGNDQYAPNCLARTGASSPDYCVNYQTYECQIAGAGYVADTCGTVDNRADSTGYDFVYDLPPKGAIATPSCTTNTTGWAFDPDYSSNSISVAAYVDGPKGVGTYLGSQLANISDPPVDAQYGITGNHGYSINLTAFAGINPRTFYFYVSDVIASGAAGPVGLNALIATATLHSCAAASCTLSPPAITPTTPQEGQAVKITATATWAPYGSRGTGAPTLPGDGFTITSNDLTGISAGSALTWDEPKESQTFTATAGAPGANFTVTAKIDDSSCASPLTVANEPYFNVDGGDTMSGSGFMSETNNTACTETTGAGTYAWNNNNTPNYYGSGTSGAAFSVSKTDEFTTNNGQSATGSVIGTPDSLSFSNDSADDGGTPYGGDFNSANCVPDYYKQLLAAEGTNPDITSPGSSVITAYPTTNGDRNVYLFTGNVYIGNGPGDTNLGLPAGANYSSPTTMPYFYVVTKGGNIYIDGNVANLAGVFIAEPSTTTSVSSGQIYTCADNTTKTEYASANIFTNCSTQLDVDGAFVAKDVHFLRTNGSVDLAGASSSCAVADPNVAEKICYTPMLWLASPFPPSSNDVQSIISLPGVL
jgi:hypothetical protein